MGKRWSLPLWVGFVPVVGVLWGLVWAAPDPILGELEPPRFVGDELVLSHPPGYPQFEAFREARPPLPGARP